MTGAAALKVVPVILAGGSGTRLWPLSRALHPKQYLSLGVGSGTLFQQAALRIAGARRRRPRGGARPASWPTRSIASR